jgi:hypothetical protein
MLRQRLLSSVLQLLALSAVAMLLVVTSASPADALDSCGYYANECEQRCGSTITYEGQWSYWDPQGCWDETTQTWVGATCG